MKHKKIDFGLLSLKPNSSQENSGLTAKLIQTMAWFTPRQAPRNRVLTWYAVIIEKFRTDYIFGYV